MFNDKVSKGLQVSVLALTVLASLAGTAAAESDGILGEAAARLVATGDHFQATTASLDVVPTKLAGGCPQGFAFNVRLSAQSPGKLTYRFVTEDGRRSQTFEAQAEPTLDGLFIARARHELALVKDGAQGDSFVVFGAPEQVKPLREPDFFERLFGTGPAAEEDQAQALRDLAFRVQVVAPNEVDSAFDRHSVSCEEQREARIIPVREGQRDDRDRPGRDDSSSDDGGRGDRGRGTDAAGGPAGAQ